MADIKLILKLIQLVAKKRNIKNYKSKYLN